MRTVTIALMLLLWGSHAALAESLDFAAMHGVCEELRKTEIVGYSKCHGAVEKAQTQYNRYKDASAEWRIQGAIEKGELFVYRLTQSKVFEYYRNILIREHQKVWDARQKRPLQTAN